MKTMMTTATKICEKLNIYGFEAYFVGGVVRDMLMGVEPHDIDITTNALPTDVQNIFPDHINTGIKHGTVSVRLYSNELFEITTYRIDGNYEDGRHPSEVVFTPSLTRDLARRDFTINAIAFDPIANTFFDTFDGKTDIENKIIRCVGNAKDRFMEDPLRVLRAIRFAVKLGFTIEETTAIAMHDTEVLTKLATCISKERVTEELRKTLTCGNAIHDIFLEFSDVIATIIPELKDCVNAPHNNPWHCHDIYDHSLYVVDNADTAKFEIKFAALLHDIGKPAMRTTDEFGVDHFKCHPSKSVEICETLFDKSLKVSTKEKELILTLIKLHDVVLTPKETIMRRMLINYSESIIRDLLILKAADIKDHIVAPGKEESWNDVINRFKEFSEKLDSVIANMNALSIRDLAINGHDIMTILNIKPGKEIGVVLKSLFDKVVNNELPNEREILINEIKHFATNI